MNTANVILKDDTWAMYSTGVVCIFLAVVFAATAIQQRRTLADVPARRLGHVAGGMTGIGLSLIILRAVADRLDDVPLMAELLALGSVVVLALVLGNLGADAAVSIAGRSQPAAVRVEPVMNIEPGQRVVWTSTLSSKWLLVPAIGVLLLGPLLLFLPDTPLWLFVAVVFAGTAALSLASIRVRADASGLHVKYGVLPWPTTKISTDQIAKASVIDVRPKEWGGWGYRGTLALMKQAAVVLRAGPGIRLDLSDGRVFVVTVDDPDTAVALLNAHRVPVGQ